MYIVYVVRAITIVERTLILTSTGSIMWLPKIYAADDITPGGMRTKLPNWVRYRAPLAVLLETAAQIGSTDTRIFIHTYVPGG